MRRTKEETSTRHIKDTDLRRQTLRCTIAHFLIRAWVGWSSRWLCLWSSSNLFTSSCLRYQASPQPQWWRQSWSSLPDYASTLHFSFFLELQFMQLQGWGCEGCSDSSNSIFRFKLVIFSIPNKYDLISRRALLFIVLFHPVHTYYSMFCRSHDWKIAVLDYFNIALFPVLAKQLANCRGHCSFVGKKWMEN